MWQSARKTVAMKTRMLWSGAGAVVVVLVVIGIFTNVLHGRAGGPVSNAATNTTSAFKVLSVNMLVNPTSVSQFVCGTTTSVTWTAIIRIAPNGPGGTIQLSYTWDEGRSSMNASIAVAPKATVRLFSFTHTGTVESDHSFPQYGSVQVTSPNLVTAQEIIPSGTCHS